MNDGAPRGIILIAVAVVIGLVLLSSGLDYSEPINADAADADAGNRQRIKCRAVPRYAA